MTSRTPLREHTELFALSALSSCIGDGGAIPLPFESGIDGSAVRAGGKSSGGEAPSANSHEPTTRTQRNCRGNESHGLDFGKRRGVSRRRITNTPTAKGRYPSREATTVIEDPARTASLIGNQP